MTGSDTSAQIQLAIVQMHFGTDADDLQIQLAIVQMHFGTDADDLQQC